MSEDKKDTEVQNSDIKPPFQVVPTTSVEKMSDVDVLSLELAKHKRHTALAEAKTALANNEKVELEYKYLVLQLYMKYGLTADDAITEAGEIVRGGAKLNKQGQ